MFANVGKNRVCLGDGTGAFSCADVSDDADFTEGLALGDLSALFSDGFESGDTSAWSSTVP